RESDASGGLHRRQTTQRTQRLDADIDHHSLIARPADNRCEKAECQFEIRATTMTIVRVHDKIRARLDLGESRVSAADVVRTGSSPTQDFYRDASLHKEIATFDQQAY